MAQNYLFSKTDLLKYLRQISLRETKTQKARLSRNPKTNEKIETPEKKAIHFKMSKEWFKKLNNNE